MRRLRILIVGLNYAPEVTGIAPYTAGMARGLSQSHQVQVLTTYPHYPEWRFSDEAGAWRTETKDGNVSVGRLRHYVPRNPAGASRMLSEASFALRALTALVKKPDVIIAVTPALLPLIAARRLANRWNVPLGVVVQDVYSKAVEELNLLGGRANSLVRRLESSLLNSASGVVAIHQRIADTIIRDFRLNPERVEVVPNWTHVSPPSADREATRRRMGWGKESVILHAGNMGVKQGLETVVEAARLADINQDPVKFILMGNGNQRAALERMSSGIDRLTIVDSVPEQGFTDILAAADALLLCEKPGLDEMCVPSKLTSYFAAGRPVIAATKSDSAAAYEVKVSGAGIVVPSGDATALLQAATSSLNSDFSRRGQQGMAYAAERLSQESAVRAYQDWVETLAAPVPHPTPMDRSLGRMR